MVPAFWRNCERGHVISGNDPSRLRGKPRFKMFQPIRVMCNGAQLRAHLLDLSATGALIHSTALLEPGAAIVVELGSWSRAARVEWRRDDKAGIRFVQGMADAEVKHLVELPLTPFRL